MICDVCGKEKAEVFLIKNDHICTECLEQTKDMSIIANCDTEIKKSLSPKEIKDYLDRYVIGQNDAKEILSVSIYNHYKMLKYLEENKNNNDAVEIEKSNIMLIGPSGVGKSYLIKNLAKVMNVPYATADANTLTEAG